MATMFYPGQYDYIDKLNDLATLVEGGVSGSETTKQIVDATYFGFPKEGHNSDTLTTSQLLEAAPDSSEAMRLLESYFTAWQSYEGAKPLIVRFGRGVYKFDHAVFTQNSNVFYPRSGFTLEGCGSNQTIFGPTSGSNKASFVSIADKSNWSQAPTFKGIALHGAGDANPTQVGVFINPDYVNSLGFGGFSNVSWKDVIVSNFAREQMWLKGGSEDAQVPVQFGFFDEIVLNQFSPRYSALKLTGQIGSPL